MKNNEYMTTAIKDSNIIRSKLYNYTLSDAKIAVIPKPTVLPIDKTYIYIGVAAIIIIIIINNK